MCGIVGYVGRRPCKSFIFEGLTRLEYRGYDSSGIAVSAAEQINIIKTEGKLERLRPLLGSLPEDALVGMGHTRWATHGPPNTVNAHPHGGSKCAIVHNGILDNYMELKIMLLESGVKFSSDTDSEIIAHLIEREIEYVADLKKAILNVLGLLKGVFALGVMSIMEPDKIYLVKQGSPLVVGLGDGESFFASDALTMSEHTNRGIFLEDGEFACLSADGVEVWDFFGAPLRKEVKTFEFPEGAIGKGEYRHYMLKEIHEQPGIARAFSANFLSEDPFASCQTMIANKGVDLRSIRKVVLTGCGTAYHAGWVGKYLLSSLCDVPVVLELASEFRYSPQKLDEHTLVIVFSQSGETADTLACVQYAKKCSAKVIGICNVPFSSIVRICDVAIFMKTGPEIGVASTKAFTAMILELAQLILTIADVRGELSSDRKTRFLESLRNFHANLSQVLEQETFIEEVAKKYYSVSDILFLGRGVDYPIAMEAALKLKEISYIHAEGYAGGELKHGPIALVDETLPIVAIVSNIEPHRQKMIANIEEVCARGARVIGVGSAEDKALKSLSADFIPCPQVDDEILQAFINVLPLQLFAYYVACHRGTDVDQPRNLAKSVTVE